MEAEGPESQRPLFNTAAFFRVRGRNNIQRRTIRGNRHAIPPSQSSSETAALPQENTEIRDGTHERTLATPPDFPESYNYGSGRYTDWGQAA